MTELECIVADVRNHLPRAYEPLLLDIRTQCTSMEVGYVVIGEDDGTLICVVRKDHTVVSIDPNGVLQNRFMNSSIEKLGLCINAHREYCHWVLKASSELEELKVVDAFRNNLLAIDAVCLENVENWWAVIVEQAEHGLL